MKTFKIRVDDSANSGEWIWLTPEELSERLGQSGESVVVDGVLTFDLANDTIHLSHERCIPSE